MIFKFPDSRTFGNKKTEWFLYASNEYNDVINQNAHTNIINYYLDGNITSVKQLKEIVNAITCGYVQKEKWFTVSDDDFDFPACKDYLKEVGAFWSGCEIHPSAEYLDRDKYNCIEALEKYARDNQLETVFKTYYLGVPKADILSVHQKHFDPDSMPENFHPKEKF